MRSIVRFDNQESRLTARSPTTEHHRQIPEFHMLLTTTTLTFFDLRRPRHCFRVEILLFLRLRRRGATNGEIAVLTIDAVNLSAGTVSLPGTSRLDPRVNALDTWGIDALERRFEQPAFRGPRIVTDTIAELSGVTSVSAAFSRICSDAGVSREGYEIDSVRRWAAIQIFESSNDLLNVARFLGIKSLDRAADWVNLNWRNNQ